jgi:GDP-L-fucose synthase
MYGRYAMAKRMLDTLNRCYAHEYQRTFTSVIPTNVYGPYDNFHLHDSHVIPGLIHKCFLAKQQPGTPFVVCGTGAPLRQFICSSDLAYLMVWAIRSYSEIEPIILATDEEISIDAVARTIATAMDFHVRTTYTPPPPHHHHHHYHLGGHCV